MTYKRRKNVRGDGHLKKSWRTKRRTKDLDEIDEDIKDENAKKLLNQDIDLDKPGAAQHYCVHCAKYFINPRALEDHFRTKVHKRRLKALEAEPYTIEESERAAGHGSWIAAKKRKIETLKPDSFDDMQADEQETVKSKVLSLPAMSSTLLRWSKISACSVRYLPIRHGSALFIPGSKASENFALLSPHLDYDSRFADVAKLRKELALRGSTEDPEELARSWEFYKCVNANKWTLERRRSEIAYRMKKLNKLKNLSVDEEKEKMQLMTEGKVLRQDMRIIKETLWEMEETVVARALKLPNEIDSRTPETSVILNTVGEIREPPRDTERKSHVDIGSNLGLLEYKNPMHYYLCDDAALLELGALSLAGEILVEAEMVRVAGTDFGRSLVVEGSGLDHEDPTAAFVLLNNEGVDWETCNRLHLVGGASLVAFLAMHTKQLINPNGFPLKYFATGRQYTPLADGVTPNGLFTVCQSSAAHAFVMVKDPFSDEYNAQFDDLVRTVTKLYDSLDVHYRVVMRSAGELRPWESLRVSFELWSAHSRRYVEVGHVSICGQYFSKRLLIAYQTPTGRDYPAVMSGTVLNVPRLLGCLLEEDTERLRIPTEIARHMPGIH